MFFFSEFRDEEQKEKDRCMREWCLAISRCVLPNLHFYSLCRVGNYDEMDQAG